MGGRLGRTLEMEGMERLAEMGVGRTLEAFEEEGLFACRCAGGNQVCWGRRGGDSGQLAAQACWPSDSARGPLVAMSRSTFRWVCIHRVSSWSPAG